VKQQLKVPALTITTNLDLRSSRWVER